MRCPFCRENHPSEVVVCPTTQQVLVGLPDEGTVLDGKYKILGVLGAGGMAAVYRAEHIKIGRIVALKVLLPEFRASAELVERVEREARAAGSIDHPNVVEIVDLGSTEQFGPYIAMEMLNGIDLATHIENSGLRLPALEAADIVRQVLSALAVAHDKGVIHRDLKPENIFLTEDEDRVRVKVLDFGISKLSEKHGVSKLTRVGMVMGTPQFMAPEQAIGAANQDHRADIYSCGVVLYALLTGALPFEAENINVLISDMINKPPLPVALRGTEIDPALAAIVMKAIERKPDDRYATAREMQDALVIWMKSAPVENPGDRPLFSDSIRMRFPSAVPQAVRASNSTLDKIEPVAAAPAAPAARVSSADTRAAPAANASGQAPIGELATVLAGDRMPSRTLPSVDGSSDPDERKGGTGRWVVLTLALLIVGGAGFAARQFAPHEWNQALGHAGLTQFNVPEPTVDAGALPRPGRSEHRTPSSEISTNARTTPQRNEHADDPRAPATRPTSNDSPTTPVAPVAANTDSPAGTPTHPAGVHRGSPRRPAHRNVRRPARRRTTSAH